MDVASLEIRIRTLESELGVRRLRSDLIRMEGGATAAGKAGSAAFGGMAGAASKLRTIIGATLGLAGFAGLSLAIKKSVTDGIKFNSFIEQQTISFKTLLGSMDLAKKRMDELEIFAARTPFDLPGVVTMSRQLEALTNGTMATEEGLRLVGGAASAVSADLESATTWMARLFTSLEGGEPFGLSIRMLKMMGLVTTDMSNDLEKLSGKALGTAGAMDVMRKTFGRFSNAMEEQSQSFGGLTETFKDGIQIMLGAATMPIFTRLKVQLKALADFDWKSVGMKIGDAIEVGFQEFAGGRGTEFIGLIIEAGFEYGQKGVDKLWSYFEKIFSKESVGLLGTTLPMVFTKGMLKAGIDIVAGLAKGFTILSNDFGQMLETAVVSAINKAIDLITAGNPALKARFKHIQGRDLTADTDRRLAAIDAGAQSAKDATDKFFNTGIWAAKSYFGTTGSDSADSASSRLAAMIAGQASKRKAFEEAMAATKALYAPWQVKESKEVAPVVSEQKQFDRFNLVGKEYGSLQKKLKELQREASSVEFLSSATVDDVKDKAEEIAAIMDELARQMETNGVKFGEAFDVGFQSAVDSWGNKAQRMASIGEELANSLDQNITDGLMGMIDGTKSVQQAFSEMANSIVNDLVRVMIQQLVVRQLLSAFGGIFGGGGSTGDWLGEAGPAQTMHDGGIVGGRRYAGGGVAGDEVPIIAHRGEVIFNESQFSGLMKGMAGKSQRVEIINVTDPAMIDERIAANPGALINVVGRNRSQFKAALGIK